MCIILDETTLEELFTRLSAVERESTRLARQLAALSERLPGQSGHEDENVLTLEQLSPVREAMPEGSMTCGQEQNCQLAKLTTRELQVLLLALALCSFQDQGASPQVGSCQVEPTLTGGTKDATHLEGAGCLEHLLSTEGEEGSFSLPHVQSSGTATTRTSAVGLTPRELTVFRLLAQGLSSSQIARQLIISVLTVNTHVRSIYSKLGVTSRSAATRWAIEHHLV
jgi:DNA-binding CsgD family transcriptional regulator